MYADIPMFMQHHLQPHPYPTLTPLNPTLPPTKHAPTHIYTDIRAFAPRRHYKRNRKLSKFIQLHLRTYNTRVQQDFARRNASAPMVYRKCDQVSQLNRSDTGFSSFNCLVLIGCDGIKGCTLIYDLKLQFIFVNFSVYSFESFYIIHNSIFFSYYSL